MFYKICKFENLTIINDIITKNNGKVWYVTLTSIKFDLCKITSRYPRKLKFKGLIAYIMFYKICKFENLTITNDIITKNNGKIWYVTLTSIKFDPDNQDI